MPFVHAVFMICEEADGLGLRQPNLKRYNLPQREEKNHHTYILLLLVFESILKLSFMLTVESSGL